ncbi:MAG: hypothetical protein GY856_11245 [bacterium]|nr:hypothetical protein [bacterium]
MTGIVGLVENETALLGGDSAGSSPQDREIYSIRNAKVFIARRYAIGITTSFRMGQILRYGTELPEPPDDDLERFMVTEFVEALRSSFETHGFTQGLGPHGSILVGIRGQLFVIAANFEVILVSLPYAAIGSGRHSAYGALYALEGSGKSLRERAEIALRAAQTFNSDVREPFTFVQV